MRICNVYNQYPQWSRKVSYEMKITRVFQNETSTASPEAVTRTHGPSALPFQTRNMSMPAERERRMLDLGG